MKVIVEQEVVTKMKLYTSHAKAEVGGLLSLRIEDGAIVVDDIIILEQEANSGEFEINEDALFDFLANNKNKAANFRGWWHSHANSGVFWSGVDDNTFDEMIGMNDMVLGVVVNKQNRSRWKIMFRFEEQILVDEHPQVVFHKKGCFINKLANWGKTRREVREKVKEKKMAEVKFEGDEENRLNEWEKEQFYGGGFHGDKFQ